MFDNITPESIQEMNVAQLRTLMKARGLKQMGTKADLVARAQRMLFTQANAGRTITVPVTPANTASTPEVPNMSAPTTPPAQPVLHTIRSAIFVDQGDKLIALPGAPNGTPAVVPVIATPTGRRYAQFGDVDFVDITASQVGVIQPQTAGATVQQPPAPAKAAPAKQLPGQAPPADAKFPRDAISSTSFPATRPGEVYFVERRGNTISFLRCYTEEGTGLYKPAKQKVDVKVDNLQAFGAWFSQSVREVTAGL